MALGDTAPLVTVAHDWTSPVLRERSFPTSVMRTRDGSEQRQSLSHLPTDRLTYRILAPTMGDALSLRALVEAATDNIIRIPRWEDQTRVDTAASAGAAVVVSCDTADRPTFVVGSQVILWRGPGEYEVTTIDGLTSSTLTCDLVDPWAAGTIVAPVTACRLAVPLKLSHWASTSGVLEFVVDCTLGDIAGVGTGGSGVAGVPFAISVTEVTLLTGAREAVYATVTDAAGNVLKGQPIVWTSDYPVDAPISYTPDPHVVIVANPTPVFFGGATITATLGAVSGSALAYQNPFS